MGIISFIIGLIVSTIIIYFTTKLLGEREGIKTAIIAAIIGSIIFGIAHSLLGHGTIAALLAGIVWLVSLKWLYKMGWIKSIIVAVIIWIATTVVGILLPTLPGPL